MTRKLSERSWTERISTEVRDLDASVTVGVALVSQRSVMVSMQETLWRLLCEYSHDSGEKMRGPITCSALVDILDNFAHQDIEVTSLKCIRDPFMILSSKQWLERPIGAQKEAYAEIAGWQLIQCLPPIPLALMYVKALLEQKIVLTSIRRSVLLCATIAATERILKPLKWWHLLVPCVPVALAGDLLQYPAPFILGMPSEDPGIMD